MKVGPARCGVNYAIQVRHRPLAGSLALGGCKFSKPSDREHNTIVLGTATSCVRLRKPDPAGVHGEADMDPLNEALFVCPTKPDKCDVTSRVCGASARKSPRLIAAASAFDQFVSERRNTDHSIIRRFVTILQTCSTARSSAIRNAISVFISSFSSNATSLAGGFP